MRKTLAALITIITLVALLPSFAVTSYAAGRNDAKGWDGDTSNCIVNDDAKVFDDAPEELAEVNEYVKDYAEELQMNIHIILAGSSYKMSDSQTEDFCGKEYDRLFGEDTDGILFFIDMSGKIPAYDYFLTSGKAVVWYEDIYNDVIDPAYAYLPTSSEGNYAEHHTDIGVGIIKFLASLKSHSHRNENNSYYYYGKYTGKYVYYKNGELYVTSSKPPALYRKAGLIGIVAAVIGGLSAHLIAYGTTKSRYKFKDKTNPRIYFGNNASSYSCNMDTFIRTYTTKTRIQSSSGGGSHGGGHHGGGTHGGGGRHR